MTVMNTKPIFLMPDQNDGTSLAQHQRAVFNAFGNVFQDIDMALINALPKVLSIFGLYEGHVDLAVHAPNTRYLVKQYLSRRSEEVIEEDEVFFDMRRVSNCGLCIKTAFGEIRVLKAPKEGLPKALSDARVTFSTSNQMVLSFSGDEASQIPILNLFALWSMDAEHKYTGLQIACPKRIQGKGNIDCYWVAKWKIGELYAISTPKTPPSDLDQIVALPRDKEKKN